MILLLILLLQEKRVEDLGSENGRLRRRTEAGEAPLPGAGGGEPARLRMELQRDLLHCQQQLQLERARNAKLSTKIDRLREKQEEERSLRKHRERARREAEAKVPYKEQLMRENAALASQLTQSNHLTPEDVEEIQLEWVHDALKRSGEFNGSVCGNGWANEFRNLFYDL